MKLTGLFLVGCLFNGIPGPILAKTTSLWLLYHLLHGTYRQAVRNLHRRCGPIVQVAPQHYSLNGKQHVYIPKLLPSPYPAHQNAHHALKRAFIMETLFDREYQINDCNQRFITLMPHPINQENIPQLQRLVTRYAWEVMLMMAADQRAGFLDRDVDAKTIEAVLKDWKFYSILYSSYLRYHPYVMWFMKCCLSKDNLLQLENMEARVALCLVAADPAITLISTALQHIYDCRKDLLHQLREEILQANIENIPTFKSLILSKPRLPLLYAVLQECARLTPPHLIDPTFATPSGGIDAAEHQLPPAHLISIGYTTAHTIQDSLGEPADIWDIEKWLDQPLAAKTKCQLLAFNISAGDSIEQFQILLAAKLLVQIVTCSETLPNPVVSSSEDGEEPTILKDNKTPVTLAAADTLTMWLSTEDAEALFTGRLAPHHRDYNNEEPIFTRCILNNYDRALVHEAVRTTHGRRLQHFTHSDTNVMCIGAYSKIPPDFRQRTQRSEHYRGRHRQPRGAARGPRSPPIDPRTNNWGNWAEKEGNRQDYLNTEEAYQERQERVKQAEDAQKQRDLDQALPQYKFKETFRRTGTETIDGKLGSVRKIVSAGKADEAAEKMIVTEKLKAVPPHMRRRNAAPESEEG